MPDSPLPPNSRRRNTDNPDSDFTMVRRPLISSGYFQGATEVEIRHLSDAVDRIELALRDHREETRRDLVEVSNRVEKASTHVTDLRLWRAKIVGLALAGAGVVSVIVSTLIAAAIELLKARGRG